MAAPSLRDRLLTRRGARAIASPVGIVVGAAIGAGAVAAGLPVVVGVAAGVGAWAVNVWRLLPRSPRPERIDPFAVQEPWRRFVQDALQARARFAETVGRAPPGPLRDRLSEIAERMQTGVDECWLVAKRGQTLVRARRGIDVADVDRQLARLRGDAGELADPSLEAVVQSLEVQRATADRLDGVITQAQGELRLLATRLDEAVARTLELSAQASTSAAPVTGLGTDVDDLVSEMESLRQALDETSVAAGGGVTGTAPPPELPRDLRRDLPPGGSR